jgi:hypothetical protein
MQTEPETQNFSRAIVGLAQFLEIWEDERQRTISAGIDHSLVVPRFMIWLLGDPECGTLRLCCSEHDKKVTETVIALYQRVINGERVSELEWQRANFAAQSAIPTERTAAVAAHAGYEAFYTSYHIQTYPAHAADDAAEAYGYEAVDNKTMSIKEGRTIHLHAMRDKLLTLLRE